MSPHVLILDADAVRRDRLQQALQAAGCRVILANDPSDAARALAVPGLDAMLLDLSHPLLDLPGLQLAVNPQDSNPPDSLDAAERRHIALTLRHTRGNRREAARLLGIARSTLLAKLRKYGLDERAPVTV
ncbi:MAG: helix-turn-helix domain-containing protein [Gemmatimonadales bacterium]